jgi:hypothetical protein
LKAPEHASQNTAVKKFQMRSPCIGTGPALHGERERASFADFAPGADIAAEQQAELPADRQTEAGAAVAPRGRTVGLGEPLEQLADELRRDADAGVADFDDESDVVGPGLPG